MKVNSPNRVYIEKRFPLHFEKAVHKFFEEYNRLAEREWSKKSEQSKVIYKMGKQVVLTFDYESNSAEVKAIVEVINNEVVVSVGNSGFPFEPLLSRPRYQTIADKIESFVLSETNK